MQPPLGAQLAKNAVVLTLALSFAANFMVRLLLTLLLSAWPAARGMLWLAALVEGVLFLGLAWLVAQLPDARPGLGLERTSALILGAAITLGVFVHGPADFVEAVVQQWSPLPETVLRERLQQLLPDGAAARALLLVAVAGVVPFAEEAFFRGPLFTRLLQSTGAFVAILVSSVCFTLSHGEARSFPALFLVALLLGWLRFQTQSLWPCFLLHAAFNATTLLVLFASPKQENLAPVPSVTALAAGLALTLLAAFAIKQEQRRRSASLPAGATGS